MTRAGTTLGAIRIQNFRARAFPAACLHAWADMQRSGAAITPDEVRHAARLRWFRDLAEAIKMLRDQGATVMVVDVGNDSGGDDSGDWAPRLFTDRLVRSARLLMIDAPVSAGYYAQAISDLNDDLPSIETKQARDAMIAARSFYTALTASIGQRRCDLSWVWREKRSWSPTGCNHLLASGYAGGYEAGLPAAALGSEAAAGDVSSSSRVAPWYGTWTGPTYVLADRRSYSSAEMFAAVMQDNRIAKLVGDRTGGDGCGFMAEGAPIVLRHSRLRFRTPNCMRLRTDGTNEEAGISPDLPVVPTEGESDRARGERALRTIVDDAGSASH